MTNRMKLNDQQLAVVETEGAVKVKAGPGTGKTTTLVNRFFHELNSSDPDPILVITFTQAGVTAFQHKLRSTAERLSDIGRDCLAKTLVSTFDGVINRYVVRPALSLIFPAKSFNFVPSYEVEASAWLSDPNGSGSLFVEDFEFDGSYLGKRSVYSAASELPEFRKSVMETYRKLFDQGILSSKVSRYIFETIVAGERRWPFESMDQSRLAELTWQLDRRFADMSARFPKIYIDEAQDSARSDYLLVDMLEEHGANVSYIGDPHQEIYRFRNSMGFEGRGDNAIQLKLTENYRSNKHICDFLNTIYDTGIYPGGAAAYPLSAPAVTITIFSDEADYQAKLAKLPTDSPWVVLSHQEKTFKKILGQPESYGQKSDPVYDFVEAIDRGQDKPSSIKLLLKRATKLVNCFENRTELVERLEDLGLTKAGVSPSELIARRLVSDLVYEDELRVSTLLGRDNVASVIESTISDFLSLRPIVPGLPIRTNSLHPSFAEKQWSVKPTETELFDVVNSGTIHSAKGLEFENVSVVVGNWKPDGQPHLVELLQRTPVDYQYEEIVNVFYVACSRAKRSLNVAFQTGNNAPGNLDALIRTKWGKHPSVRIL